MKMLRIHESSEDIKRVIVLAFTFLLIIWHVYMYAYVLPVLDWKNNTVIELKNQYEIFSDVFGNFNLSKKIQEWIIDYNRQSDVIFSCFKEFNLTDEAQQEIFDYIRKISCDYVSK